MVRAAVEDKLYKIGEVCKLADLQPYVLRYWETEFPQLSPNKSGGGQRLYTRAEVDTILKIKDLLYREGFTIAGAKKQLEIAIAPPPAPEPAPAPTTADAKPQPQLRKRLGEVQRELRSLLAILDE